MSHHNPQLTLRELLAVVAFVGLAIAALCIGGILGSIAVAFAFIVTTCAAIIAFVGRDELRSFAVGFVITVLAYTAMMVSLGPAALSPYGNALTTRLIRPLFERINQVTYVDISTGEAIPNYDPATNQRNVGFKETLDRAEFMKRAHV